MSDEVAPYEESMTVTTDSAKYTGPTPPYIALTTFQSMLDKLREHGVPPVFDGSYFGNISGSTIALHRATFKAFGLMDDEKAPTPLMRELAQADDERRKEMLTGIGREMYADCIALAEQRGTTNQLADLFRAKGITGATVQKAISFYLSFAEYAGYPTSPFFKKGRITNSGGNGSTARRARKKATAPTVVTPAPVAVHQPTTGRTVEEEQKAKYIDLLMKLAAPTEGGGDINADILDRIERMLNVEVPKPASTQQAREDD
ncbi:hypothetical protein [Nostocoides veronense]|uniref:hypothetical protein n=1 Tax=Nostocoides veronense TaxID=330836 RepID=UPI0031E0133E